MMMVYFTYDRHVVEFVKNDHHFVLVYPDIPAGRMGAKGAVRDWLLDCELDFDRLDADMLLMAIDASRFQPAANRFSETDMRCDARRSRLVGN